MVNPLKALADMIRRRVGAWRSDSEYIGRVIKRTEAEICLHYQVERAEVLRIYKDPPRAVRHMSRPGPAWFLKFAKPGARGIIFVEVDDATERVTRTTWASPR
jgi:hypothetical protein